MNLRAYQSRAVDFLAARKRALCVCPAGGGKTIIGASAAAKAAAEWERVGWLCNTREQVEQGEKALARAGVKPAWVKCAAGLSREDTAAVDFLIIDEAHHLLSSTWHLLADACQGTIWGLTATPKTGNPDRDFAFNQFWGPNVITIPRSEVEGSGHLAQGVVRILDIDQPGEFDEAINGAAEIEALKMGRRYPGLALTPAGRNELLQRARWATTLEMLVENPHRNETVINKALQEMDRGQSVLILVARIEQGERYAERISGAELCFSKMGIKKRRSAIERFRTGELPCMIATSLADEGLDVPRASVLILATAGRSGAKVEQRTGRVMRPSEGKSVGLVYDFADVGASMAKSQSYARQGVYRKLGYRIEKQ